MKKQAFYVLGAMVLTIVAGVFLWKTIHLLAYGPPNEPTCYGDGAGVECDGRPPCTDTRNGMLWGDGGMVLDRSQAGHICVSGAWLKYEPFDAGYDYGYDYLLADRVATDRGLAWNGTATSFRVGSAAILTVCSARLWPGSACLKPIDGGIYIPPGAMLYDGPDGGFWAVPK